MDTSLVFYNIMKGVQSLLSLLGHEDKRHLKGTKRLFCNCLPITGNRNCLSVSSQGTENHFNMDKSLSLSLPRTCRMAKRCLSESPFPKGWGEDCDNLERGWGSSGRGGRRGAYFLQLATIFPNIPSLVVHPALHPELINGEKWREFIRRRLGSLFFMLDMPYCLLDTLRDLNKKFMPTVFVEETSCSLFIPTDRTACYYPSSVSCSGNTRTGLNHVREEC